MLKNMNNIKIEPMKPLSELASFSKFVAGEGIVLLKNDDVLPIINKNIAVFGRIAFNYYKSGTGSGGLVNVKHVPSLIEALLSDPNVLLNKEIYQIYKKWIEDHPFDYGNGQWASEPWHQKEMEIDPNIVSKASKESDIAVVVFGRTAGEDKDNQATNGSYYLTKEEDTLLNHVTTTFKKTIVILNVGNAMDLSFLDRYAIDGLICAWHGGQYGALALKDMMLGYKSPSGKLPFSLIKDIQDDPSHKNFGHKAKAIYEEDIYIGYRFFETFKPEAVRFPFGYGLTYTTFNIEPISFDVVDKIIEFSIKITNTGQRKAKEVVQIYVEAPQGLLGKPKRVLVGFVKTKLLGPNESITHKISIDFYKLSSYDDYGHIYKSAFVLEKGIYQFYVGNSSKDLTPFGVIDLEDDLITQFSQELAAPIQAFKRIKPDHDFNIIYEDVPLRTVNYNELIKSNIPKALKVNQKDIKLLDVYNNKFSIDEFIGSLKVEQLIELTRGEGMSSPKVTAGTAAAFGGVTNDLLNKGIPIACAADGPSGIRMDSGFYASSLPNGILLASTFDLDIVETLYQLLGKEMKGYEIDVILGPGMNIIRHPLNGRNFEYFSEDPLLTGLMAASAITGLRKEGVTGTLKHLYGNNQETDRFNVDAVISERAQREIYLRCFEIAIKVGHANAIMTSYNPVNSLWTASQFEINTLLLRNEWGFEGILVTDWWAKMNDFNGPGDVKNTKAMIISQNDLYMVISDAKSNSNQDNSQESYDKGLLTLGHLQKVAKNIVSFLMTTPSFHRMHDLELKQVNKTKANWFKTDKEAIKIPLLNHIEINHEKIILNPLVYNHYLPNYESLEDININHGSIFLSKDKQEAIIQIGNEDEINLYYIYTKQNTEPTTDLIDLNRLNISSYLAVGSKSWEPLHLDFKDAIYDQKSIQLKDDLLNITLNNAYLSYPVDIKTSGKYLIDFTLQSPSSHLAQLPFSIYLDNVYKTTLTIHGTEGETTHARASILAETGKKILTIKFNKSNIFIHDIKMMRHG